MSIFVDGVSTVRNFDDFDALAETFPTWDLEAARTTGGAFSATVALTMTADLQLVHFTANTGMVLTGSTPVGVSGANMIISAPQGVRSRGRAIDTRTTAPARVQSGEVHFLTAGPAEMMVVGADQSLFERHVRGRFGRDPAKLGADWLLRAPAETADCAERGRALLALQSVLSNRAAASREARHRLQECVLQILLEGLETDTSFDLRVPTAVRRRIGRAAEEVIRARLDDPPSLREICELLGVPERTLHYAFQECFGMPPKTYLRGLRLSAAYRRLRQGQGPVTVVAADLGLFHFGRFSIEYRAMFGETPSATLRRAAGGMAAR